MSLETMTMWMSATKIIEKISWRNDGIGILTNERDTEPLHWDSPISLWTHDFGKTGPYR